MVTEFHDRKSKDVLVRPSQKTISVTGAQSINIVANNENTVLVIITKGSAVEANPF